jgi:hypothetical protein
MPSPDGRAVHKNMLKSFIRDRNNIINPTKRTTTRVTGNKMREPSVNSQSVVKKPE